MKRTALVLVKMGVSLALLTYLLSSTDLGALYRRVRGGDTMLLAAAVALYTVILLISTWRWKVL
ncbi:MAG TPA: hypothetical protein VFQ51_03380, partial [Vicinamibacteria bacterium]|nr:hypothetical protein [Vicinamibacteria bacterium]